MSNNWVQDISDMHQKFGVHDWVDNASDDKKRELMKLRIRMIAEEFNETLTAYLNSDAEEFADGLIDLCVFAIGTLDIAGVDANEAWNQIWEANMAKEPGVKPGRPNPLGLPDLLKPAGWKPPSHENNHGNLEQFFL